MKINYKSMLRNVPAEFNKEDIERLASKARVKYVINGTIHAYSPVFKDVCIETYGDTMGCRRGDEIEIKIGTNNRLELVQNLTLQYEIFEYQMACMDRISSLASKARVKYVMNGNIYAYSPMFKDVCIETHGDTMGCRRGDEIEIKIGKNNRLELVENLTLQHENFEYQMACMDLTSRTLSYNKFSQWRDAQLKNQKQH